MNATALKCIAKEMNMEAPPTAVQGRIFGSKGMWALRLHDEDTVPKIWIRKSQQKIQLTVDAVCSQERMSLYEADRAQFIFDLISPSRVTMPSHLSKHTIINLHHNGVPADAFKRLMQESITRELEPLMPTDGPHAMQLLCAAIDKAANVSLQRAQQYATGTHRAFGIGRRWEDESNTDDDDVAEEPAAFSLCYPGGRPVSSGESATQALRAGFNLEEEFVFNEVKTVQTNVVNSVFDKLRLLLPCSGEAPMVSGMHS
jgi:RNA-dependent RNA polymerase